MKKFIKIFVYAIASILGLLILIALVVFLSVSSSRNKIARKSLKLAGPEVMTLTVDGITFRDLPILKTILASVL